jgi:hypothetical protein
MIVGAYSLHLYCDEAGCNNKVETYGSTKLIAFQEAKRRRWQIDRAEVYCYCFKHSVTKNKGHD